MIHSLATAMHAIQTTVATTLGNIPGALAFAWDMFLNMSLIPDWQAIARTCEHHVNENLQCGSRKQHYTPGQQVLNKVHDSIKLGVRMEGPYTIEHIHIRDYWAHQHTQGSALSLTIPHTPLKKILSKNWIWGFHFLPLIFFLHLTFEWVVGRVFWIQFLFVHLFQSKSCHGGEECCAHGNNLYEYGG